MTKSPSDYFLNTQFKSTDSHKYTEKNVTPMGVRINYIGAVVNKLARVGTFLVICW